VRSPLFIAAALLSASALLVVGCSSDGDASSRTIDITMTDNAYAPPRFSVPKGETVTLRFTNDGSVRHEAVLGDEMAQQDHHDEMSASSMNDDMDMGHGDDAGHGGSDDGDAVTVEPGKTGSITTRFDETGTVLIGCHEPGHWEDGMKATIDVG